MIRSLIIEPYYDEDGITIYNARCEDVLPQIESVDVTVTSPPYNLLKPVTPSGLLAETPRKKSSGYDSIEDNLSEDEYQKWMSDVFNRVYEKTKNIMWINHKTRFKNRIGIHPLSFLKLPLFCEIIWDRFGSTMLNAKRYAVSHESIFGFGNPEYWNRELDSLGTVWRILPERQVDSHPCPFPVTIPKRLIESSCKEGGIVLDPFMGSGTTLRAAMDLGKKAIGIEVSERYCEVAANRLRQKVLF